MCDFQLPWTEGQHFKVGRRLGGAMFKFLDGLTDKPSGLKDQQEWVKNEKREENILIIRLLTT